MLYARKISLSMLAYPPRDFKELRPNRLLRRLTPLSYVGNIAVQAQLQFFTCKISAQRPQKPSEVSGTIALWQWRS
jgi:hypothetical protein